MHHAKSSHTFLFFILSAIGLAGVFFAPKLVNAAVLRSPPSSLGLVGYWKLDDGTSTKATDFSGSGNTGTLVGSTVKPTWVTGKFGRGVNVVDDINEQYIEATTTMNLNSAGTVAVWFNASYLDGTQRVLFSKGDFQNDRNGIVMSVRDSVGITWELASASAAMASATGVPLTTGRWYQVVLTWDGADVYAYLNASQIDHFPQTLTPITTVYPIRFGNDNVIHRQYRGAIDDVRIYNRALSAGEVSQLYSAGAPTIKAKDNTGLIGYWSFEDATGTKATDFSGNGNTGTLAGSGGANNLPQWVAGKRGKALSFDGNDDRVDLGSGINITTQGSFCLWYNLNSTADSYAEILTKESGTTQFTIGRYAATDRLYFYDGTNTDTTALGYGYNQWVHLCVVINSGALQYYLNGVAADTGTTVNPLNTLSANTSIGINNGQNFKGLIDDVRIYNRALSAADVLNLYNAGATTANPTIKTVSRNGLVGYWSLDDGTSTKATDFSGNGNTGTLTNGPLWTTGKRGRAVLLDGSDDFIDIPSATIFDNPYVTVCAWASPTVDTNSQEVVSRRNQTGENSSWRLGTGNTNGEWRFEAINSGGTTGSAQSATGFRLNEWQHICGVFNGSTVRLFTNGSQAASSALSGTLDPISRNINIGTRNQGSGLGVLKFNGRVDDVRVYSRVLAPDEIQTLYTIGK